MTNSGRKAELEPRELLATLVLTIRRWWCAILITGCLLALTTTLFIALTFQPTYVSNVWLHIYTDAPYLAYQSGRDSKKFVENQVEFIKSPIVLATVANDKNLTYAKELHERKNKLEWLKKNLSISPVGNSEYIEVSFAGKNATTTRIILKSIINSYSALHRSETQSIRAEMERLLGEEKLRREAVVESLQEMLTSLPSPIPDEHVSHSTTLDSRMTNLGELRRRLTMAEVDEAILTAEINAYHAMSSNEVSILGLPSVPENENESTELLAREINQLEDRLLAFRNLGAKHPTVLHFNAELDQKRQRLSRLQSNLQRRDKNNARASRLFQSQEHLSKMQLKLEQLKITSDVLKKFISTETEKVRQRASDALNHASVREELAQATEIRDLISTRLLELTTEQVAPARVRWLNPETESTILVESMPFKKIAIASCAAFSGPLFLLFFAELWMRRVVSVEQLRDHGLHDVVAEIPFSPKRLEWTMPRSIPDTLFLESVNHLSNCVLYTTPSIKKQVIAVLSAASGEGKTSLAFNLATTLGLTTDKKVLFIDGDLRNPSAHTKVGCELSKGLSDVLKNQIDWQETICTQTGHPFHTIPAGELISMPNGLFTNERFAELIQILIKVYDHIIIDTPPVLAASEALIMAKIADSFLLCVRKDLSRINLVRETQRRLISAGANPMGIVLTGIPLNLYKHRYGIYSSKYLNDR